MTTHRRRYLRLLAIPAALAAMPVALAVSHHYQPPLEVQATAPHASRAELVGTNHDPVRWAGVPTTIVEPGYPGAGGTPNPGRRAPRTSHEATSPAAGTHQGLGSCGGDLPPCYVLARESGGDPGAVNPSSGAAGRWQMLPSTSRALGYPRPMNEYPASVQDEAARRLYAGGAGCAAWVTC